MVGHVRMGNEIDAFDSPGGYCGRYIARKHRYAWECANNADVSPAKRTEGRVTAGARSGRPRRARAQRGGFRRRGGANARGILQLNFPSTKTGCDERVLNSAFRVLASVFGLGSMRWGSAKRSELMTFSRTQHCPHCSPSSPSTASILGPSGTTPPGLSGKS